MALSLSKGRRRLGPIKEVTRYHYDSHQQLDTHPRENFVTPLGRSIKLAHMHAHISPLAAV
jgi:hypothetical protein